MRAKWWEVDYFRSPRCHAIMSSWVCASRYIIHNDDEDGNELYNAAVRCYFFDSSFRRREFLKGNLKLFNRQRWELSEHHLFSLFDCHLFNKFFYGAIKFKNKHSLSYVKIQFVSLRKKSKREQIFHVYITMAIIQWRILRVDKYLKFKRLQWVKKRGKGCKIFYSSSMNHLQIHFIWCVDHHTHRDEMLLNTINRAWLAFRFSSSLITTFGYWYSRKFFL